MFIPTYVFIFICWTLGYPGFIIDNPFVLLKFLTFTYRGAPGVNGIGACWYVFMLGLLYLITPYVCKVLSKIKKEKVYAIGFIIIIMAGLVFRLNNYRMGLDWSGRTYASVWGNLDLYLTGVLMAFYRENIKSHPTVNLKMKILAVVAFLGLIIVNEWIYNQANLIPAISGIGPYWFSYQYLFPTVYACIVSFYFYVFHEDVSRKQTSLTVQSICQNPLRCIDWFAGISFEFYLFHSWILANFASYIQMETPLATHMWLLGISATVSIFLSIGFHRVFKN